MPRVACIVERRSVKGLTGVILCALAILAMWRVCPAGESHVVGTLSADRESMLWRPVAGDTVRGRHDDSEQLTQTLHRLRAVWGPDGLHTPSGVIAPSALSVSVADVSGDHVELVFSQVDSLTRPEDLRWSSERADSVAAGDAWLGSFFVFDAGAAVYGEVLGNVIVLGGDLTVGEAATVRGDVILIGGTLRQSGDAKIYGRVFSPGGHRRPRLTITRAWEFEDGELKWSPTLSYDRVDGARPGARFGYQRTAFTPRLELWSGYAFASKTWQIRAELRQRLMKSADVEAVGSIFRLTQTDDDSAVSQLENTVFAALTGTDHRDYYGADGGEISVTYKYRERSVLTLGYRNLDYRQMDAHRNLWHLFRPDHDFRENFSTLSDSTQLQPPRSSSVSGRSSSATLTFEVSPVEKGLHPMGFNGRLGLSLEAAGGILGGAYNYERLCADATGWWDSGSWHHVKLHAFYGVGRHNLPPNKLFYLGGLRTLPGYSQKTFFGEEALLAQVEYQFTYWNNRLGAAAVILFGDVGRVAPTDSFWHLEDCKADVGIGLQFADAIRIDAAKGLDQARRDIRVTVRLTRLR